VRGSEGGRANRGGRRSGAGRPERPLDPEDGPLSRFACELRQLRAAAGYPSYRELAGKALFSASVLSAAASGSSLPSLQVALAYASACGGDAADWQRRWGAAAADLGLRAGNARVVTKESALTPAELPPAPACYTGREPEAVRLAARTDPGNLSRAASVVISGPIGVGKTAFALHFAQRVRPFYPDGQLYAELTGSRGQAYSAHDVTGSLLGALGLPAPADPRRRCGLYRSVLAERRVLVMLDNAGREAMVRPLLAAGSRSLVVITSRGRLAGLDNAGRVTLDALPSGDSRALITAVAGSRLATISPGTAESLGELCGHLPLALWIAATRLSGHHDREPEETSARLMLGAAPLDWLRAGDVSMRQRLRSAYQRLTPPVRQAFRALGVTGNGGVTVAQIARRTGTSALAAGRLLEELVDHGLLQVAPTDAGYHVPPLFAAFARELAGQPDPVPGWCPGPGSKQASLRCRQGYPPGHRAVAGVRGRAAECRHARS